MRKACAKCGAQVLLPEFEEAQSLAVRQARQIGGRMGVIQFFNKMGLSLLEAKALGMHLAEEGGKCHRCGHAGDAGAHFVCTKCKALNIVP